MASRFSFDEMGMMAEPEVPMYTAGLASLQPGTFGGIGSSFVEPQFFVPSWIRPQGGDVRGTTPYQNIALNPGTMYRLVDFTGRNDNTILAQGSTPEELSRIQNIVNTQLVPQGRRADWRLEQITPEGESILLGGDYYNKPWTSTLGDIAKIAAPIALQFVPGFGTALGAKLGLSGVLGKAAGVGLTSALGRTGAGIATGENVGQALKSGAIGGLASGATAGLLNLTGADKVIGSALGGAKGTVASTAAQSAAERAAQAAGEEAITVVGQRILPSLVSGGISAGIGNIGSSLAAPSQFDQAMELARMQNQYGVPVPSDEIVVSGLRGSTGSVGGDALSAASSAFAPSTSAPSEVDPEITVTGQKVPPAIIPGTIAGITPELLQKSPAELLEQTPESSASKKKPLTAAEIARLGLGGLTAIQGLANLFGAGGSGSGSPGIGSGFNETVSFEPLNRTRNVATFDPFTYGQSGGEFRFFGNERPVFQVGIGATPLPAPIAPTTPGPDAGIAPQPEVPVQAKRGGPIRGIGGGQDDKIPAMLSDGEYVFSAQDVADLGDGSNDEGARRLDEMRKLIRKQAGRRNTKTIAKPQKSVSSLLRAAR